MNFLRVKRLGVKGTKQITTPTYYLNLLVSLVKDLRSGVHESRDGMNKGISTLFNPKTNRVKCLFLSLYTSPFHRTCMSVEVLHCFHSRTEF